jgi:hypothetical protein
MSLLETQGKVSLKRRGHNKIKTNFINKLLTLSLKVKKMGNMLFFFLKIEIPEMAIVGIQRHS